MFPLFLPRLASFPHQRLQVEQQQHESLLQSLPCAAGSLLILFLPAVGVNVSSATDLRLDQGATLLPPLTQNAGEGSDGRSAP